MRENRFPKRWNEDRVREVLLHYEQQTEEEAVAEDEAAFEAPGQAVMVVPQTLVPTITKLIEKKRHLRSPRNAPYLANSAARIRRP